jgi:predicted metal-dependent HD superfamily phosphohydrolase
MAENKENTTFPCWINTEDFQVQYLYTKFMEVFFKYVQDTVIVDNLFEDVYKKYNSRGRHYHNMAHIYRMTRSWAMFKNKLRNPDAVFMAIIYHDIVYKPRKSDNEEKSREYFEKIAKAHLQEHSTAGVYYTLIDDVKCAIMATKHNDTSIAYWKNDLDIQYLLDFDLEILGTNVEADYDWYRQGVRKEYRIYPNILYKPGRKKVLESFLLREKIYLTEDFKAREEIARKNLKKEINSYLC